MKKQPKLLSHASLRRPFIVTVSAIAAIGAAACGGGQIEEVGGGDGEIVTNPPAPTCPTAQPADGDACDVASTRRCGYRDCGGTPSVTAECKTDLKWHVSTMSCNPPPPPSCPAVQPVSGAACNLEPSQACGYKDCFGTPAVTAKCSADKTWSVLEHSCNPPPPPPEP